MATMMDDKKESITQHENVEHVDDGQVLETKYACEYLAVHYMYNVFRC